MLAPLLLLAPILPQTEASPTPRERLEALIESTNELEHFSVEYSVKGLDGPTHLWVDYRAPRSILLRVETPEGLISSGCNDDSYWMTGFDAGGAPVQAQVDLLDRGGVCEDAIATIRENGWYPTEGPGVSLGFSWRLDSELDKHDFNVGLGTTLTGSDAHNRLLGWLHNIEHLEGDLTFEGEELVHRSSRAEARIDGATGFLRSLVLISASEVKAEFELIGLELDAAPSDGLFATPDPDPAAIDRSDDLRKQWVSRSSVRLSALRHVHNLLDKGTRRLDEELHNELERFFVALYDSKITGDLEAWLESRQRYPIEYSDWIRAQRQAGRSREELETAASERRGEFEATLEVARSNLPKIVPADPERYADSPHWHAIRKLEDEVLNTRFDVLVARPLLDDFDARVDAALDS